MILTEALAIKELEKAFGSFEAGTFKRTLEEIALLTDRKISEIEQAFANAGLTAESFKAPSGGGSNGTTGSEIVEAPSFAETGELETMDHQLVVEIIKFYNQLRSSQLSQ